MKMISFFAVMAIIACNKPTTPPPTPSGNFWKVNGITYQGNPAKFYSLSSTNNQLVSGQVPYKNDSSKTSSINMYFFTPSGIITAGQYLVRNPLSSALPAGNECKIVINSQSYYGDTSWVSYENVHIPCIVTLDITNGKKKATFTNASCRGFSDSGNLSDSSVSGSISE